MAKTNIPATGATSRMPRTMNFAVSSPNPPTSAAVVGTRMSATSGETRLLRMAARRVTTVPRPRRASIGRLLSGEGQVSRHLDFEAEQQEGERLAVRIQAKGLVDAAVEYALQHEVQRVELRQHVPPHGGGGAVAEHKGDAVLGHLSEQQGEELGAVGDHADVERVALVPGAPVGEAVQRNADDVACHHSSTKRNVAGTRARGTRHDAECSRGVRAVRTPPPPAGPQVYSAVTSRNTASTRARSGWAAATRSRTSRASPGGRSPEARPASSPKTLSTPIRSQRSARPSPIRRRTTSAARRARDSAFGPA